MYTKVKTADEIAAMRESGRMLANVLNILRTKLTVGMSTKDLANIAKEELKALGGTPPFLGYYDFPDVICISVNEEVVHGIPRADKIIRDGDLVSMDFGVLYRGMITDSAITVIAGTPRNSRERTLVDTTRVSLEAGIEQLHDGVRVGDVAQSIQQVLEGAKLGIVRELVGHGVGHELHEDPNIPNYGRPGSGPALQAGMTIAIEPMATLGDYRVAILEDEWTVVTRDGSRSAHFEHSVLITESGFEILTTL